MHQNKQLSKITRWTTYSYKKFQWSAWHSKFLLFTSFYMKWKAILVIAKYIIRLKHIFSFKNLWNEAFVMRDVFGDLHPVYIKDNLQQLIETKYIKTAWSLLVIKIKHFLTPSIILYLSCNLCPWKHPNWFNLGIYGLLDVRIIEIYSS